MPAKPRVAIVGPGNLGTATALTLRKAGYAVSEIIYREGGRSRARAVALARKVRARTCDFTDAELSAEIIWLCVPDRQIAACATSLAPRTSWKKKIVLHSSGALASDELITLRQLGASAASLHPLMTFVPSSTPSLVGVPFAAEGDSLALRAARAIVRDLGGDIFLINKENKAAYHAWGSFSSPLLIALLVTAEQVAHSAGIRGSAARKRMLPILRQTLSNYAEKGAAKAFSGPIIRGDADTVRKHLETLKRIPDALQVYVALARSALRTLPNEERDQLEAVLANW